MLTQPLETERLLIRRFTPADWPDVFAYTSNAIVMAYLPEGQMTESETRAFVEKNSTAEATAYAVTLKAENCLIGHMDYHIWFAPHTHEVGWVFHPAYQRKGYATEAARALLKHSFELLKAHRVIATCQPENPASYRVMEKLGMRREGYFRKCIYRRDNLWWDEYFYAILEEEWFAKAANPHD